LLKIILWHVACVRRKIQIVDIEHDRLVASHSTYVMLGDGDFNVSSVATKVQESVNSEDSFVLLDSKNQEMTDCPVTQGLWVTQTVSIVLCFCSSVNIQLKQDEQ